MLVLRGWTSTDKLALWPTGVDLGARWVCLAVATLLGSTLAGAVGTLARACILDFAFGLARVARELPGLRAGARTEHTLKPMDHRRDATVVFT